MTLKRIRSGNGDEWRLRNHSEPPAESAAAFKLQQLLPPAQRGAVINQVKFADFLKFCHSCDKKIPDDFNVFMYRDLCAFCSPECRGFQIAVDDAAEKAAEEKARRRPVEQVKKVIWE